MGVVATLGALAGAIREYGGGVLMITHNNEFSGALCNEIWNVEAGKLVEARRLGAPAP